MSAPKGRCAQGDRVGYCPIDSGEVDRVPNKRLFHDPRLTQVQVITVENQRER